MFKRKDIKQISRILKVDEDAIKASLSITLSILRKQPLSTYSTARAVKVFLDKVENSRVKSNMTSTASYPLFNFKHKAIKLCRVDVISLHLENIHNKNYGYGEIAKEIKRKYKIDISRSTVKLYIQKWKEYNEQS